MFIKKIKALIDTEMWTGVERVYMNVGQVVNVKFKDVDTYRDFMKAGVFAEAGDNEKESKVIPILKLDNKEIEKLLTKKDIVTPIVKKIVKISKTDLTNNLPVDIK